MTAGTVVITGGILATVILLCIIAVLCYCRLQVLPREGGGDLVGVEPEGWLSRGSPQEDREAQGPGCSGGGYSQISAGGGRGDISVQFSGQMPNSPRLWLRLRESQGLG